MGCSFLLRAAGHGHDSKNRSNNGKFSSTSSLRQANPVVPTRPVDALTRYWQGLSMLWLSAHLGDRLDGILGFCDRLRARPAELT